MRILFVSDYSGAHSGAEAVVAADRELLRDCGHAVETLAGGSRESLGSFGSRWFSVRHYAAALRLIERFKPDLLHAHSFSRMLSPSPLAAAKRCGIPTLVTFHDAHLCCGKTWAVRKTDGAPCPGFSLACTWRCRGAHEGAVWLPYYLVKSAKIALHRSAVRRWADHIVCPSAALAGLVRRSFRFGDRPTVSVLPLWIADRCPPPGASASGAGPVRFLFAGRLAADKGLDVALDALALLFKGHAAAAVLDVAGDGPLRGACEARARHLGMMAPAVVFHGRLDRARLDELYAACHAVLVPSVCFDNFPLVAIEAMMHSRPILASRIGGLPELVQDGVTGRLFAPGDSAALAAGMARVLAEPDAAAVMGRAGRAAFARRFTRDRHVAELEELYQAVAGARRNASGQTASRSSTGAA